MTSNEWIDAVEYFIRLCGDLFGYLILFRGRLRVSPRFVVGGYIAICALELALNRMTVWAQNTPLFILESLLFYMCVRERRIMSFTVYCFFVILISCFGSVAQGGLYGLMTAVNGSAEWLVKEQAGLSFRIIAASLMIPTYALACYLMLKLKPIIMNAERRLQIMLIAAIPIPCIVGDVVKNVILDLSSYANNPDGVGLIIDSVRIVLFFVVTGVLLAKATPNIVKNSRLKSERLNQEKKFYRDAAEELLRRRHDSANWALAGLDSEMIDESIKKDIHGREETR